MKPPRFKLSTVPTWMTIIALLIVWYTSLSKERARNALLTQRLQNAEFQVGQAERRRNSAAELISNDPPADSRVFTKPRYEGVSLRDLVIQGGSAAFQLTVFDNSDLTNASLSGGASSFQEASFRKAILKNAELVGSGS